MSRDPQDTDKLQAPSVPELKDELQVLAKRLGRKVKFRGRKMGYGPLINAIVINYLSLSAERQLEIAESGIKRYEAILASDEPVEDPRLIGAVPDEVSGGEGVLISRRLTESPKTKRENKPAKSNR